MQHAVLQDKNFFVRRMTKFRNLLFGSGAACVSACSNFALLTASPISLPFQAHHNMEPIIL